MYSDLMLTEALKLQCKYNESAINRIVKNAAAVQKIEQKTGMSLIDSHYLLYYGSAIHIDRRDLPTIRKVVGRLTVYYKNVADDYDTSKELEISLMPLAEEFKQLRFVYRTPHRGKKCRVETTTKREQNLVCDV